MPNTALNRSVVLLLTNKSGGAAAYGATVILDSSTASSFTTTTTANQENDIVGVVIEPNGIANDAVGLVCIQGFVPKINLTAAASLGDYVFTHTVAGQAQRSGTKGAGAFGQVLAASASPAAVLWGFPLQSGSGAPVVTTATIQARQVIYDNTLGAAGVWDIQDVDLSTGAYADYEHLQLLLLVSRDAAINTGSLDLKFNNDTTAANYRYSYAPISSGAISGGAGDNFTPVNIDGDSSPASNASHVRIDIPFAQGTSFHKDAHVFSVNRRSATEMYFYIGALRWENTAAISRIALATAGGNFNAGSRLQIIGMKNMTVVTSVS